MLILTSFSCTKNSNIDKIQSTYYKTSNSIDLDSYAVDTSYRLQTDLDEVFPNHYEGITYFSDYYIESNSEKFVITTKDKPSLHIFSKLNFELLSRCSMDGNGPGEGNYIIDSYISEDNHIFLLDGSLYKVIIYDSNCNLVNEFDIEAESTLFNSTIQARDKDFIIIYNLDRENKTKYTVYNSEGSELFKFGDYYSYSYPLFSDKDEDYFNTLIMNKAHLIITDSLIYSLGWTTPIFRKYDFKGNKINEVNFRSTNIQGNLERTSSKVQSDKSHSINARSIYILATDFFSINDTTFGFTTLYDKLPITTINQNGEPLSIIEHSPKNQDSPIRPYKFEYLGNNIFLGLNEVTSDMYLLRLESN